MIGNSPLHVVQTDAYSHLLPADMRSEMHHSELRGAVDTSAKIVPGTVTLAMPDGHTVQQSIQGTTALSNDFLRIDMDIRFPPKEKVACDNEKQKLGSILREPVSALSSTFMEQRFPEPEYFQNVDCVGLPNFFTVEECRRIIDFAEAQGFHHHRRERVMNLLWADLVDPTFAQAIWSYCGLGWFLRTIHIDGMVPCGLNEVIRIQKYEKGGLLGRHTDQYVKRSDGKVSRYSLRVFLNGTAEEAFEGGMSVFHVPFRPEPVTFAPKAGLALLYPQGELCTCQEEAEVLGGHKYVLRADVLFCRPEDLKR
mmetsp:Transcript_34717/g.79580  ORF Transcript_34717/g.79580 Transcript_34717/m.79580 type:complete len:310 (+) Transcript_34717:90-1019(+)